MSELTRTDIDTFTDDLEKLLANLPSPLGRLNVNVEVTMTTTINDISGKAMRTFVAHITPRYLAT